MTPEARFASSFSGQHPHPALTVSGILLAVGITLPRVMETLLEPPGNITPIEQLHLWTSVTSITYVALVFLRPSWAAFALIISWALILSDPAPGGIIFLIYLGLGFAAYTSSGLNVLISISSTLLWVCLWVPMTSNLPPEALWVYVPATIATAAPGLSLQSLVSKISSERQRHLEAEEKIQAAREREREELARELHDIVAHELTVIAMQARAGALSKDIEAAHTALKIIGDYSRSGLEEMRRMISAMRSSGTPKKPHPAPQKIGPPAVHGTNIPEALQRAKEQLDRMGIPTAIYISGDPNKIPPALKTSMVTILREGTTNTIKHAGQHATCNITLEIDKELVILSMRNTLPGEKFDFPSSGYGLVGIRERVLALGGEMIAQRESQEWLLSVRIPLDNVGTAF